MKTYSFPIILIAILLCSYSSTAQVTLSHSIRFYNGDFVEARYKLPESPIIQTGISYEYRMDCKDWIGLKFFLLHPANSGEECLDLVYRYKKTHRNENLPSERLTNHFFLKKFTEAEFTVEHMFYIDENHNRIGISASVEHCWTKYYVNALGEQTPDGTKIVGYIYPVTENYNGFVPAIMYDYNFFRQRFNIGADVRYHIYQQNDFQRTDLLVHAGINF